LVLNKMIVYDLFGGGWQGGSVYLALGDNQNYDIYTFDVTKPSRLQQYYFNLAPKLDHNGDIIAEFEQFRKKHNIPLPDIIVASPLCQSFSSVTAMRGGGTASWIICEDGHLELRDKANFEAYKGGFTKNYIWEKQHFIGKLGKECIENTIKLIQFYEPKYWYIENPMQSLMWNYIKYNLEFNGIENICSYGSYGYRINKKTKFLSNIKMELLNKKIPAPYIKIIHPITKEIRYTLLEDIVYFGIEATIQKAFGIVDVEPIKYFTNVDMERIKSTNIININNNIDFDTARIAKKQTSTMACSHNEHFAKSIFNEVGITKHHVNASCYGGHESFLNRFDEKMKKPTQTRGNANIGMSVSTKASYEQQRQKVFSRSKATTPFSTEQISEASQASHIPENLIRHIFSYFEGR